MATRHAGMRKGLLVFTALSLFCLSHAVQAIPIRWRIDTVVTENFGGSALPRLGEHATVRIRFDSEGIDARQIPPSFSGYDFIGPHFGMDVFVAGVRHRLERLTIGIFNDADLGGDIQGVCNSPPPDAPFIGDILLISGASADGSSVRFGLYNCDATAFDSTDLIQQVPALGRSAGQFLQDFNPEYGIVTVACCDQFSADVLKITAVPEPNTSRLLAVGLLLIGAMRISPSSAFRTRNGRKT